MTPEELAALLDTRQVAALLRMTPAGVRRIVKRGGLTPDGHGSRGVHLFKPETVARYITRAVQPAPAVAAAPTRTVAAPRESPFGAPSRARERTGLDDAAWARLTPGGRAARLAMASFSRRNGRKAR